MNNKSSLFRSNARLARTMWGKLSPIALQGLKELGERYALSVAAGDLLYLDGRWYVTHAGLLRLAHRNRCSGIRVQPLREFCDAAASRWVFKATVYKSPRSKGFVGFGDAEPSNVSSIVRGAEMRVARDPGGQPRPAQSLWHRVVLGGGDRVLPCPGGKRPCDGESPGGRRSKLLQQRPTSAA